MKKNYLKRTMALVVAAAVTVSSLPASVFAEEQIMEVADEAIELVEEQDAEITEEPAADAVMLEETPAEGSEAEDAAPAETAEEAPAELEVLTIEELDAVDAAELYAATPVGKIQNVQIDEDNEDHLTWNADIAATRYEISVKDANGYEYRTYDADYVDTYSREYWTREWNLYAFKDVNGTLEFAVNEDGHYIYAFEEGVTYTISVRGVNEYGAETVYGEWSDPVTYLIEAAPAVVPAAVTDLTWEAEENYLTWVGDAQDYEIAVTDADGNIYCSWLNYSWDEAQQKEIVTPGYLSCGGTGIQPWYYRDRFHLVKADANGTLQYVTETKTDEYGDEYTDYVYAFEIGKTYSVAVRPVNYDNTQSPAKELYGEWSAPVSVTVTENAKPGKTGQLSWKDYYLTWNQLENVSGYEVEVKDADGTENLYETDYNSISVFEKGRTYTVRVRGYNYTLNSEQQVGEWSDAYTFTYADDAELSKVSGVHVSGSYLYWNADENAEYYEIAVADAANRSYYTGYTTDADGSFVMNYKTTYDTYMYLNRYDSLYPYVTVNDYPKEDIHADGTMIRAFEDGGVYTMCVRSVRETWDSTKSEWVKTYGEWSNVVTYDLTMENEGINAKPATVTGVKVVTEDDYKDAYDLYGAELRWNYVENAAKYEILITDASGNEYINDWEWDGDDVKLYYYCPQIYKTFPYAAIKNLENLFVIKKTGNRVDCVKDANGKELRTFVPGETYSISVRAVNQFKEWDAAAGKYKDTVDIPGDWSAAVSYTAPAVEAITDLAYAGTENGTYYFTYSADAGQKIWYQIAADDQFTEASMVSGTVSEWDCYSVGEDKLLIWAAEYNLKPGTTYYLRAAAGVNAPTKAELAQMTVPVAAFTTEAAAPKAITGLYVYKNYSDSVGFRFDAVLDEDDSYELQYTDKAAPAEEDWITEESYDARSSAWFDTYHKKAGTYYVRAVAYEYINGEKVYGTPSNTVAVVVSRATSAVGTLSLKEQAYNRYVFDTDGAIREGESVEYWVSTSADFPSDKNLTWETDSVIYYDELTPGTTYYVRARVYNDDAETEETRYSAFSNVVSVTAKMPKIFVSTAAVTSTSVTLEMSAESNEQWLTGYQIQKKIGKKYVTLAKTTKDTYKNSNLTANKTYTYRVRPYYYNEETASSVYGTWKYAQVNTWGASLELTATPTSKTSVKLTWNKVKGASGYEIYRYVTDSDETEISGGLTNSYSKYTLVKTIKKASTVKYTDKKLTSGLRYEYMIRAYKTVNKKKYYIDAYAWADLSFGNELNITKMVYKADGSLKVYWSPMYAADGYSIEKYDEASESWIVIATKKKSTSSYTLAAGAEEIEYRIRPYKGSEYAGEVYFDVYPALAAPTGVKAVVNADKSVTVTWNAVEGADYYMVYRTTSTNVVYNKDTKSYDYEGDYEGGKPLPVYTADATKVSGWKLTGSDLTGTTYTDREITYTANGLTKTLYAGPAEGVAYNYYVVAYRNRKAYNVKDQYDYENSDEAQSGGSKAASVLISETTVKKPTLRAAKAGKGKITLTWKKVTGAEGYAVYRSTKKKSGYQLIATISKGSTVKYVDKTAKSGKKYYYKIRAIKYNEAGATKFSSYSKVKSAKAK